MKKLDRQKPPAFWSDRICQWVDLWAQGEPAGNKLHDWQTEGLTLARWFHETVRPLGEGHYCAYCDGLLGAQSPETIDHWVPQEKCRALALWWGNLFPACVGCQQSKGTHWSIGWLRPDVDNVEELIVCNFEGKLEPAYGLDNNLTGRIQDTINGLGLNRRGLVEERRRILMDLTRLYQKGVLSTDEIAEQLAQGSYRFLLATVGAAG
ncbi:MAG: hypothetical protein IPK82_36750 [Polyangiaceae bacterium]|nr:hypothetical protein [Polyangiaceae bacterium]